MKTHLITYKFTLLMNPNINKLLRMFIKDFLSSYTTNGYHNISSVCNGWLYYLWNFCNSLSPIYRYVSHYFDLFHILLSSDILKDPWNIIKIFIYMYKLVCDLYSYIFCFSGCMTSDSVIICVKERHMSEVLSKCSLWHYRQSEINSL